MSKSCSNGFALLTALKNVNIGVDSNSEPLLATFNSTIFSCSPVVNIAHHISSGSLSSSSSLGRFDSQTSNEGFGNRQVKVTLKRVSTPRPSRAIRTKVVRIKSKLKRENPNQQIKFDDDYEQVPDMMMVTMPPPVAYNPITEYQHMPSDTEYDDQQDIDMDRLRLMMTTPKPLRVALKKVHQKQMPTMRPFVGSEYGGWKEVNNGQEDIDYSNFYQRKEDSHKSVKPLKVKLVPVRKKQPTESEGMKEDQIMTSSRLIPSLDEALAKLESNRVPTFVSPQSYMRNQSIMIPFVGNFQ